MSGSTYTTKKGSVLPLMKLKGKEYMLIAHRMVWLVDEVDSYSTHVELVLNTSEETLAKATIIIYDQQGKPIRRAEDYKRESKKDFPDYTEKAISGSLGRALAQLGFGTAYALQDLDEGTRLADSPVETNVTGTQNEATIITTEGPSVSGGTTASTLTTTTEAPKKSEFKRSNTVKNGAAARHAVITPATTTSADGWD